MDSLLSLSTENQEHKSDTESQVVRYIAPSNLDDNKRLQPFILNIENSEHGGKPGMDGPGTFILDLGDASELTGTVPTVQLQLGNNKYNDMNLNIEAVAGALNNKDGSTTMNMDRRDSRDSQPGEPSLTFLNLKHPKRLFRIKKDAQPVVSNHKLVPLLMPEVDTQKKRNAGLQPSLVKLKVMNGDQEVMEPCLAEVIAGMFSNHGPSATPNSYAFDAIPDSKTIGGLPCDQDIKKFTSDNCVPIRASETDREIYENVIQVDVARKQPVTCSGL